MSEFNRSGVSSLETAILDDIDHIAIATHTIDSLFDGETINQRVIRLLSLQEINEPQLIKAIFDIGRFVQPVDPVLGIDENDTHLSVFMSGATIALETAGFVAEEAGLSRSTVYKELLRHFMVPDLAARDDIEPVEKFTLIGQGIIERGHRSLAGSDETYGEIIEMIEDQYAEVSLHSGIFRAAFGYVLDAGMRTAAVLRSQAESESLLQDIDFEAELLQFLDSE